MTLRKIDGWIDRFQMDISQPVTMRIANFARVPLINATELSRIHHPKCNLLMVVIGPFDVVHGERSSMWQPFKVMNHQHDEESAWEVASTLCRLNSSSGRGGFYQYRLWDKYTQEYVYYGDPDHKLILRPEEDVIKGITEYLAAEYHVGFPEDTSARMHTDAIIESNKKVIDVDSDKRDHFEKTVEQERKGEKNGL